MVFARKADNRLDANSVEPSRMQAPLVTALTPPAENSSQSSSIIGNDLSIEGQSITIRCRGTLRVNGSIQADLHSRHLVVGQDGVIAGSIAATDVDVYGRVQGAIFGTHVLLRPSAQVEGDIHSENLQIEKGATFEGRSRKVLDCNEIAPKLGSEPTAAIVTATSSNGTRPLVMGAPPMPFPVPQTNT